MPPVATVTPLATSPEVTVPMLPLLTKMVSVVPAPPLLMPLLVMPVPSGWASGARQQAGDHRRVDRPVGDLRRAGVRMPRRLREIRMQRQCRAAVFERRPVAGVEVAFRRQSVRLDGVVPRQLDVKIRDGVYGFLHHRDVIDQRAYRDQRVRRGAFAVASDEHGVIRRQPKIAKRPAQTERVRAHPHRPDLGAARMAAAIQPAAADPDHRRRARERGAHAIADRQALHRHLAPFGRDAGALGEAGDADQRAAAGVRRFRQRARPGGREAADEVDTVDRGVAAVRHDRGRRGRDRREIDTVAVAEAGNDNIWRAGVDLQRAGAGETDRVEIARTAADDLENAAVDGGAVDAGAGRHVRGAAMSTVALAVPPYTY